MSKTENETIIGLPTPFTDDRGVIQNLLDDSFGSALVIRSNPGAVRGNHYHKTDFHYCYLQSGKMLYAHRPVGSTEAPQVWTVTAGQMFYSPPMYEHAMVFLEESVMFTVARNNRTSPNYEADTVRITPPLEVKA